MSANVAEYNFSIYRGTTFEPTLRFKSCNGEEIPIGKYSLKMEIKRSPTSAAVDTLTLANGRITTDATTLNYITLHFPVAVTTAMKVGTYVYDIAATSGTNRVKMLTGMVFVKPEVTGV